MKKQPDLWNRMVKKGLVEDWEAAPDWGDSPDLADEADASGWDQAENGSENYDQTDLDDEIPF